MTGGPRLADCGPGTIDVLGLGVAAVDDMLYVAAYPPPDAKVPVPHRERHCGGLTATALVAATRAGARCSYAGVMGTDDLSDFVVRSLAAEGIDLTYLIRRDSAHPIHSIIVVGAERHTRNIFFSLEDVVGADDSHPPEEIIRAARVLFIDTYGPTGMIRAAKIARAAGIPVVADLEGETPIKYPALIEVADHVILSHDFAAKVTGENDPRQVVTALWSSTRETVVVTCGAEGCWYVESSSPRTPLHQPAYRVEVTDTTGCGDVFHGVYAAALAQGADIGERVRLASAAAALKATRPGGQSGIPTRAAIEAFLETAGAQH
jgi:sugar/nucleoside kinase (ribokinase family)